MGAEVEATTCETDQVADRHRDPNVTVRPTEAEKTGAAEVLRAEGWTIQSFLLACLRGFLDNPKRWLRAAEPYRPPEKPIGRPRKRDAGAQADIASDDVAGELVRERFEEPA